MMKYVLALILTTGLSAFATTAPAAAEAVQTETIAAPEATQAAAPSIEAGSEQTLLAPAPEAKAKLAENEIPLNLEAKKAATEGSSSATKALVSMMIVGILLAVSYFGIRRYKTSNTINKSNTKIKVISQHYLGPKKSLAIIHVAGESILVGITDQNISMIKSLSLIDDEVPETLPNTFGQTLTQANAAGDAADGRAAQGAGATSGKPMANAYELDEEFSFANVTETVSKKIKSMRSIS
jgi:flagellar protein FliO/FliZ